MERITGETIEKAFAGAADFVKRDLQCGPWLLSAYFIDGLTASGFISDYVFKPLVQMQADSVKELYEKASKGGVYNAVGKACPDMKTVCLMLVNGFCVVCFPDVASWYRVLR